MNDLPEELRSGPFTRARAIELGVSPDMFKGSRFVRVYPRVWRLRDHAMSRDDWVLAARLALPTTARLTGISRLQQLGLDFGARTPLHFVCQGPLHLAIDGIFLHRTKRLAPTDDVGVTPAAAYLFYCSHARVIDAIKVGDWLLSRGHMTIDELRALALSVLWRDGADEALWILAELDARSRSLKESETRAVLRFAGLPCPEPNARLPLAGDAVALGDLVFRPWNVVVEYEGAHHQEDRAQYSADLDRYALFRAHGIAYVQVTHEKLGRSRTWWVRSSGCWSTRATTGRRPSSVSGGGRSSGRSARVWARASSERCAEGGSTPTQPPVGHRSPAAPPPHTRAATSGAWPRVAAWHWRRPPRRRRRSGRSPTRSRGGSTGWGPCGSRGRWRR